MKKFFFNISIFDIVFFGFFLRILTLIFYSPPKFADTEIYLRIGNELFSKGLISSHVHMPGYPIWMYLLNYLTQNQIGYLIGDIIISSITIYIVYQLAQVIFKDELISKISAFIFSIYPFSIFYSISGLSETLYVFLILSSLLLFYKNFFFFGSVIIVLSIYVKGMSDYIAPILIIIFSFFIYKNSLKTTFKHIALYFFIYCLILSPWWIHNWNKYNEFVRTDLAYGYHIYSGNNIMNESGGGIGGVDVDHSKIFESNQNDFVKSDKVFKQEAYKYILEDPIRFLKQSIRKFYRFWSFSPYTKEYKGLIYSIVSFISFGFVFLLSIFFLLQNFRNYFYKISPLLTLLVIITAIYTLTIVSLRYRYPIEPILIIFASFTLKKAFVSYKLL